MSPITISLPQILTVKEGESLRIPLTKTGVGPCSVQLMTAGADASVAPGYEPLGSLPVTFTDDQTENVGLLVTLPDEMIEADEILTVWAVNPENCVIMQPKCTVTILDATPRPEPQPEPALPVVSIPPTLTAPEGTELQVPLTKTGTGACTVELKTTGQTARTLGDYIGYEPQLRISFSEDQTEALATLRILDDVLDEADETLTISVLKPQGCTVGSGACQITITNVPVPSTGPGEDPDPEPVPETPDEEPGEEGGEPLPEAPAGRFPRAIGFATGILAGRGKPFYRVRNLNDSGPGSLREGLKGGHKMVVFEISGCIRLRSTLMIEHDNLTIAGQTAPGQGISVQGKELQIRASNIRVEHITFERGHDPSNVGNADCLKISPGSASSKFRRAGVHFSHCAFLWGLDETVEMWPSGGSLSTISFSDCIFAEPLWRPQRLGFKPHEKVAAGKQSEHNYGVLLGYGTKKVDIQNCLFAEMYMRCPFVDHGTTSVIANNILLNVRQGVTIQMNRSPAPKSATKLNCQGILAISGPQSGQHTGFRFHAYPPKFPAGSEVFVGPLYGWRGANATVTPGTNVTYTGKEPVQGPKNTKVRVGKPPIQPPGTTIKSLGADGIFERLVHNCGPFPRAPKRVPSVARIIRKLRDKRPGWVDHQNQVGGFSHYPSVTRRLEDAVLPDGTKIPVPKASDPVAVQRWLDLFTSMVSND
jgi:hypothetical protein